MRDDDTPIGEVHDEPIPPPERYICKTCFDFFVALELIESTDHCHACRSGTQRRPGELEAIRRFWLRNPTHRHIEAFTRWHRTQELAEARRHLHRFRRRSARRWSRLGAEDSP